MPNPAEPLETLLTSPTLQQLPAYAQPTALRKTLHSIDAAAHGAATFTVLPNAERLSAFEAPRGLVSEVPAATPLVFDLVNRKPVTVTALVAIRNPTAAQQTDAYYEQRRDAINAALPQYSALPPQLNDRAASGRDTVHWEPELGSRGLCGVYRCRVANGRRNEYTYHLGVHCAAEVPHAAYYEKWATASRPADGSAPVATMGELAADASTAAVVSYTARNARRLLVQLADALEVDIPCERDAASSYAGDAEYVAPVLAVPDVLQINNEVRATSEGRVAVYNAAAHVAHHGQAVLLVGPNEGLAVVPLAADATAFPTGFRRCLTTDEAAVQVSHNPALAPTTHYCAVSHLATLARLNVEAHEEPSNAFYKACRALGLDKAKPRLHYEPVLCKVGEPALERHTVA